jgi:hypothetical protein
MSTITAAAAPAGLRRLWQREMPHYPDTARRMSYLAITVVAELALLQGARVHQEAKAGRADQ